MFRGLPRVYWILGTGELINRLGSFVLPLLALYLTTGRGLSVESVGFVIALWGAGSLAAGPLGGWLADRFGRRRTLIFAQVAGAAAMLHLAFARAPGHIAAAALLLGLFRLGYPPPEAAGIAGTLPGDEHRR